jgi:hypothetical protein
MAKLHIAISATPIQFNTGVEAFCGEVVPYAQPIPTDDLFEAPPSTILFCKKCFSEWKMPAQETRYLVVIMAGQESLTECE